MSQEIRRLSNILGLVQSDFIHPIFWFSLSNTNSLPRKDISATTKVDENSTLVLIQTTVKNTQG